MNEQIKNAITALEDQVTTLSTENAALEARVGALEARLTKLESTPQQRQQSLADTVTRAERMRLAVFEQVR